MNHEDTLFLIAIKTPKLFGSIVFTESDNKNN
jgi:hypothetical protein